MKKTDKKWQDFYKPPTELDKKLFWLRPIMDGWRFWTEPKRLVAQLKVAVIMLLTAGILYLTGAFE